MIELVKVAKFPETSWLASVRTDFGEAEVRWCGDRASEPGEYYVEWTVDEDIVWGRNARSSARTGPGLRADEHRVVLRGRLNIIESRAARLELSGTVILLDLADPLPEGVAGTWVELFVEREKVSLHPYEL